MLPDRVIHQEDHRQFRQSVRRFFEQTLVPNTAAWTKAGVVPRDYWLACGRQGILAPQVPETYGGPGADYMFNAIVIEELAYTGFMGLGIGVHSDIVAQYLLDHGDEAQRRRWLPKLLEGSVVAAIAMTEPGTGSDLRGMRTTAVQCGDDYILTGAKTFISNGQTAGVIIVAAVTVAGGAEQGISLFLVEEDRPGFLRGRNLEKLGMKAQDTSELSFHEVRIPAANRLGEVGRGLSYLMAGLPQERVSVGLLAMAAAQKAFDVTVDYVRERRAFGQRIADFQNTQFKLAELGTELSVGWAYLDQCLVRLSTGELSATAAAKLKLWTTEMQGRVVDACLQLHGGYGFMSEYPISQYYADARVQRIYGGTSEIMKLLIGREIVGRA